MQNHAILLLGSNQSNVFEQLNTAIVHIGNYAKLLKKSSLYRTAAWGNTQQDDFINQCISVETPLSAKDLLKEILATEQKMGRVRTLKWQPRNIDIDILFFNNQIIQDEDLQIPHPHIQLRRFALEPLCEIAPEWVHPILNKTALELLSECPDLLKVEKL